MVLITINQGALPAGVAGRARDDLALNTLVQLGTAQDNGFRNWRWELVEVPQGSTAALDYTSVPNPTFTPDVEGTYQVKVHR